MTSKSKPDNPEQSKSFLEAARKAGADETEKVADRAFKKVAAKVQMRPFVNGTKNPNHEPVHA